MSDPNTRQIATRLVVEGNLHLLTPAHLGTGERGVVADMEVLRDPLEQRPLLPGTSLAGALRSYLRSYEYGFFENEAVKGVTALLFGVMKGSEEGEQSALIIDDALATSTLMDIRDGVRIDPNTHTAVGGAKYDFELVPAGTVFPLRFELLLPDDSVRAAKLREALAVALHGLEIGEIALGARKNRGFGRCQVEQWNVTTYNLGNSRADLLAWLTADRSTWGYTPAQQPVTGDALTVLGSVAALTDARRMFTIVLECALDSPLLIRSEDPVDINADNQPDAAYQRNSQGKPIVPGTSLAGVLRTRAWRILSLLQPVTAKKLDEELFGSQASSQDEERTSSRLIVAESQIEDGAALVQNRVAIDRFTGGAYDTALFAEAPYVGGKTCFTWTIRDPKPAQKGLLMLLLKDVWTGDLTIGGTSSIGRGRMRGVRAAIHDEDKTWQIETTPQGALTVTDDGRVALEAYVQALVSAEGGR